jgi:hypothetical protein
VELVAHNPPRKVPLPKWPKCVPFGICDKCRTGFAGQWGALCGRRVRRALKRATRRR